MRRAVIHSRENKAETSREDGSVGTAPRPAELGGGCVSGINAANGNVQADGARRVRRPRTANTNQPSDSIGDSLHAMMQDLGELAADLYFDGRLPLP